MEQSEKGRRLMSEANLGEKAWLGEKDLEKPRLSTNS